MLVKSIISYIKSEFFLVFSIFYEEKGLKKMVQEQTLDKFISKEGKEDNEKTKMKKLWKVMRKF